MLYVMLWHGTTWYGMVWYDMVWYGMVWYGMVWYGIVWYVDNSVPVFSHFQRLKILELFLCEHNHH